MMNKDIDCFSVLLIIARSMYVISLEHSYDAYVKDRDIVRFSTNRSNLDLFVAISNVIVTYKLSELCSVEVL